MAQWYQEEHTNRQQDKAWRAEDMRFKQLERVWRDVDSKRWQLNQVSEQLESLARLSSYMCYAETAILINQHLPNESEFKLSHALLGLWGVLCVVNILVHLTVMLIANTIHISILQVSAHEGPEDTLTDAEQYKLDGSNPDGIVMHPYQVMHLHIRDHGVV
jgi:hypothetical protein